MAIASSVSRNSNCSKVKHSNMRSLVVCLKIWYKYM